MHNLLNRVPLISVWQREFAGYSGAKLRADVLAGLTTGAVALPLALAFGVASGADAPAGLVTAILAGLIIGGLGGAAYQISGPTGAMSAILIAISARYGIEGVWIATLLAGVMLIALGLARLGRYISFIPSPVIAGFTSGIALIIAIGQLDNVLGIQTPKAGNALEKLLHYFTQPLLPDWHTVLIAGTVIAVMLVLPRFNKTIPASLVGIIVATVMSVGLGWNVPIIGDIPRTILLDHRLTWEQIPWAHFSDLLTPAVSIAALGAIESLLCGAVGSTMSGKPFDSNQELVAQGIGNLLIPFFGGVPATAAIARTSVAIKSGAVTRLTSIVHALLLLLSALALGPIIRYVPLAALGGVLLVTAWRMNEWESIHFFANARLRHALAGFFITMLATAALDLTQAILIGIAISAVIYLRQSAASTVVTSAPVNPQQMQGMPITATCPSIHVYYLTGPVFFGSVTTVLEAFETAGDYHTIIISMRGVPLVDAMGIQALHQIVAEHHARGGEVIFTALQPNVLDMFRRTGLFELVGARNIYWSSADAIVELHEKRLVAGCPRCHAHSESCQVWQMARARLSGQLANQPAPGSESSTQAG
ncbi:sulfate permease [Chloroflexus islandicus]|uniref:Sulfate permease n=1 Tax=Chloroflexus islandicus TaxID=1707952 RepID=A0A178MBD9_9CHLR|nr:SulP family inorganic anion transporter [Chloroflexus islandicus]OAN45194.1 sulfate permease [Chloroflexus islandicus]